MGPENETVKLGHTEWFQPPSKVLLYPLPSKLSEPRLQSLLPVRLLGCRGPRHRPALEGAMCQQERTCFLRKVHEKANSMSEVVVEEKEAVVVGSATVS
jgi:hypothetical protein